MTELAFIISTMSTVGFIAYMYQVREKQFLNSHQKLINALIAKDANQLRDLTLADRTEVKIDNTPVALNTEFEETAQLSDAEYMKFIKAKGDDHIKEFEEV